MKHIFFIFFVTILFSCTKKNEISKPSPGKAEAETENEAGEIISFDNDLSNKNVFYYLDSLDVGSILNWDSSEIELLDNNLFLISEGKIFLKNPYVINKVGFNLKFKNKQSQELKELDVKVRGWLCGQYYLKTYGNLPKQKFLVYTKGDVSYFFKNDKLYRKNGKKGTLEYICEFLLEDYMYNQMIADDNYFAVRTGNKLFVSFDLKNWKLIFSEARGIKQSMVIVNNVNGKELLFSEYNPGNNYIRQAVRAYNFLNQKIEIRKLFYSRNEYNKDHSLPTARHIHFLLSDPYSKLIFLGNGDLNNESAIYYSDDNGLNFKILGGGEQIWRSLTMVFTPSNIFWTSDTQTSQYILRLSRSKIREMTEVDNVQKFPLINGALWCSEQISPTDFIQSSNNEGGLYDNKYRNFYVKIVNETPKVYEVFSKTAITPYDQKYPVGIDVDGFIYLLDLNTYQIDKIKVAKS